MTNNKQIYHSVIIDDDLRKIITDAESECQPKRCTPELSREYWMSFKNFLTHSGLFARTWNLYSQVKKAPDTSFFEHKLAMQDCEDAEALYKKAAEEWCEYLESFNQFVDCMKKVGISLCPCPVSVEDVMLRFVLIDDRTRGNCRREYCRVKYVSKALDTIRRTGFSEPISLREIEDGFQADKAYQRNYYRKRKR